MTQVFNEDVHIKGILQVQDNTSTPQVIATQDGNLTVKGQLEVQDAAGGEQVVATDDGRLLIADAFTAGTADAILEVHRKKESAGRPNRGLHVSGELENEASTDVAWSVHEVTVSGSTAIPDRVAALRAAVVAKNALDTAVGVDILVNEQTGGAITDAVGLEVNDVSQGTNNYAIRTGKGTVALGDKLELAVPNPVPSGNPASGKLWLYLNANKLFAKLGGLAQTLVGTMFSQTSSVTRSNTTSDLTLIGSGVGSTSLPADTLVVGKTIRLRAAGLYGTAASGANQLTLKFKVGTETFASATNTLSNGFNNRVWMVDIVMTCRTTGGSGTVFTQGLWTYDPNVVERMQNTTTNLINTTGSNSMSLTAQWSVANASNTITCTNLTIEVLN